ncbi:hypothetical protein CAQU_05525 [Corynebacterium aquilae DSM 44791]|uniref:Uncharacterized protein n=1 Tax=Corynebacterium aquilae DSM 44791 TaxID=1431546 RepID=A0A1L7CFK3_9CORY|nr:hypothetical protein CAQU_05525 [Corynebacterium aquilae DSM 44791]
MVGHVVVGCCGAEVDDGAVVEGDEIVGCFGRVRGEGDEGTAVEDFFDWDSAEEPFAGIDVGVGHGGFP